MKKAYFVKKTVPLARFIREVLQTSNSIEVLLYYGIIGWKYKNLEEAIEHLDDEVKEFMYAISIFFWTYFEDNDKFDERAKKWEHSKKYKAQLAKVIETSMKRVIIPENWNPEKEGYYLDYDGVQSHWGAEGMKAHIAFLFSHYQYCFSDMESFGFDSMYQDLELTFSYSDDPFKDIESWIEELLKFDDFETWCGILNNIYYSNNFDKNKSHFEGITHRVENWGRDGSNRIYGFYANKQKSKTHWTIDDYDGFPVSGDEKLLMAELSNEIGRFIPVYIPPNNFPGCRIQNEDRNCYAVAEEHIKKIVLRSLGLKIMPKTLEKFQYLDDLDLMGNQINEFKYLKYFAEYYGARKRESIQYVNLVKRLNKLTLKDLKDILEEAERAAKEEKKDSENKLENESENESENCDVDENREYFQDYDEFGEEQKLPDLDIDEHTITLFAPLLFQAKREQVRKLCCNYSNSLSETILELLDCGIINNEYIVKKDYIFLKEILKEASNSIEILNLDFYWYFRMDPPKLQPDEQDRYVLLGDYRIVELKLDRLNLNKLPKSIGNLTELVELRVQCNNLVDLPFELKDLKNLESLWFEYNPYEEVPAVLGELSLDENSLELYEQDPLDELEDYDYRNFDFFQKKMHKKFLIKTWKVEDFYKRLKKKEEFNETDLIHPDLLKYRKNIEKILKEEKHPNESLIKQFLDERENLQTIVTEIKQNNPEKAKFFKNYNTHFNFEVKNYHIIRLSLCDLGLTEFPQLIHKFSDLEFINVDKNQITEIPLELLQLQKLKYLQIEPKHLSRFPEILICNPKLRLIDDIDDGYMEDRIVEAFLDKRNNKNSSVNNNQSIKNIDDLEKQLWDNYVDINIEKFAQEQYKAWTKKKFLEQMVANKPATAIDRTFPYLSKIRGDLEDELKKIPTKAAKEFLQYLQNLNIVNITDSDFKIFL
ncbi:hypothetical protein [Candidatus Harpocratesius sp.]